MKAGELKRLLDRYHDDMDVLTEKKCFDDYIKKVPIELKYVTRFPEDSCLLVSPKEASQ